MTSDFAAGNYRFIPAVFQYSSGAAANPGFEIERVRFDHLLPLAEGFAQIAKYIQAAGRPLTAEPSFYAFSFTRPGSRATPSFVIAGGAEARGGAGSYPERIVRYRDMSPEAWKEKVRFTVGLMEDRLAEFGFGWRDTTAAQAYTVHDFHPVIVDELVRRGATRSGLTWHFARPPVVDLEFEMDCRRVMRELVI
jgi:hypothetical protein